MKQRFKLFTIICFLALTIISTQMLQAQVFSIPLRISSYYIWGGPPNLVIDSQGNINVVTSFNQNVYFTRSSDGGVSFSPLQRLSNEGNNRWPKIAVDEEDNIYIFWILNKIGYKGIAYSSSPDGINFSDPWLISDPYYNGHLSQEIVNDVAVDKQGKINLIINKTIMTNVWTIVYRCIADEGQTLLDPVTVTDSPGVGPLGGEGPPHIYVDYQGNINVVWLEYSIPGDPLSTQVMFSRSTDGGQTFSPPINISTNEGQSGSPRICIDAQGNINVIWTAGNIYFSRSVDGVYFTNPINFYDLFSWRGRGGHPELVVDEEGNINIVWSNSSAAGTGGIFFSRSTDNGQTFSSPLELSHSPWGKWSHLPKIDADSQGNISVIFESNRTGYIDIFFTRSTDGVSFSDPVNVSNSMIESENSRMAIDSEGSIHIIWTSYSGTYYSNVVISMETAIRNLKARVERLANEGKIDMQKTNGIIRKLDEALRALEKGNERVACNKLHDFIDQINAAINSDPLTPEEGQVLIDAANQIINQLCGS